jgi:hypothetical protein
MPRLQWLAPEEVLAIAKDEGWAMVDEQPAGAVILLEAEFAASTQDRRQIPMPLRGSERTRAGGSQVWRYLWG